MAYEAEDVDDDFWTTTTSWQDLLSEPHVLGLLPALQACAQTVLNSLENNLHEVQMMRGNAYNIRNNWRRRCNGVLHACGAGQRGELFASATLQARVEINLLKRKRNSRKFASQSSNNMDSGAANISQRHR